MPVFLILAALILCVLVCCLQCLFVVVGLRAPEPPFEALEVSTTPMSISSPAQPPPTAAEESNRDKPKETSNAQVKSSHFHSYVLLEV